MNIGTLFGFGGLILGGIVGGLFGNPALGASIGGSIGGILGATLFPEKFDVEHPTPPKPKENRSQISTYGAPIPVVYESARLAGNIIYMSPINQTLTQSKHRQDGRRYFEYDRIYTATFAVAFCEGPVIGVKRMWINNDIWLDYTDSTSESFTTSQDREAEYLSIYTGEETQTYDTYLANILTAAETPAYKGICYILFKDFPLGEYSSIPKIEIEIGDPSSLTPAILLGRTLDITLDDDGVPSGVPGNQPGYTGLNIDFYYYGVAYEVSAIHAAGTVQSGYAYCAWWPAGRRVRLFVLFDGDCYHSDIVTPYTEGKNSTTFSWIKFPFTDGPTFSSGDVGDSIRFGFEILDGGAYGVVKLPGCPSGESWLFDYEESGSGCEASGIIWLGGGVNLGVIFVNY